jgi:hypothetical protein
MDSTMQAVLCAVGVGLFYAAMAGLWAYGAHQSDVNFSRYIDACRAKNVCVHCNQHLEKNEDMFCIACQRALDCVDPLPAP